MLATIQKWGNSQGIRIPKKIMDSVGFEENGKIEILEMDGKIIIQKFVHEYANLDELFEGYEGTCKCSAYDFGEDIGREKIW